jgi:hypothetical protein
LTDDSIPGSREGSNPAPVFFAWNKSAFQELLEHSEFGRRSSQLFEPLILSKKVFPAMPEWRELMRPAKKEQVGQSPEKHQFYDCKDPAETKSNISRSGI